MTAGWIFDYGGTLDTGGQHWGQALWHCYERQGVPVDEVRFREAYVYAERTLGKQPIIGADFTFHQTLQAKVHLQQDYLGLTGYEEAIVADLYALTQAQTAHSRQVLSRLKEQAPMVLVSNFYGNINIVLREMGLEGLFCHVIESAVVGVRKPNPRIFLLGVEALGLPAEAVTVVGDSLEKDIIPAREVGCRTVWLMGEGWQAAAEPPADTRIIGCLDELLD